ncbi:MAG TPA: hypothetical protein VFC63_03280 [Blastocatellia bacterium]|nr:hypothetical protein [Blastocatellia bacterium]
MKFSRLMRLVWLVVILAAPGSLLAKTAANPSETTYKITIPDPGRHIFHVAMRVNNPGTNLLVKMPMWMQAIYEFHNYAEQVQDIKAHDSSGASIEITAVDNHTWRISPKTGPIVIDYDLDVSDKHKLSGKSYLEKQSGVINGGAFFLYTPDTRRKPSTVTIILPKGWSAAAALDSEPSSAPDTISFDAKDYDELTDSPIILGQFKRTDFTLQSIPFSVITDAHIAHNRNEIVESAKQIAAREVEFFGGAPFDRYIFMYYSTKDPSGGGYRTSLVGTEHLKSTIITVDPDFDVSPASTTIYRSATAHELFHAWNVKAVRPVALNYPDFDIAPAVQSLWLLEGFTEYYAQKFMFQLYDNGRYASFYDDISEYLQEAQYAVSLTRLSLNAPLESVEEFTKLYSKGTITGLLLDLKLRQMTHNRYGLDDFMRHLWQRYGRNRTPYNETDLLPILNSVGDGDLSEYYKKYITGMDPLPLNEYLAIGGWKVDGLEVKSPYIGWQLDEAFTVVDLDHNGNAARAGVKIGDKLVGFEKNEVNVQTMNRFIDKFSDSSTVSCTVERNGDRINIQIRPIETLLLKPAMVELSNSSPVQIETRRAVLSATNGN